MKAWIEIALQDEQGNPVSRAEYQVTASDGTVITGLLDDAGKARIQGIDPGNCKVTFPLYDRRECSLNSLCDPPGIGVARATRYPVKR